MPLKQQQGKIIDHTDGDKKKTLCQDKVKKNL